MGGRTGTGLQPLSSSWQAPGAPAWARVLSYKAPERAGQVQLREAKSRQRLVPGYMRGAATLPPAPGAVQCVFLRHQHNQWKKTMCSLILPQNGIS